MTTTELPSQRIFEPIQVPPALVETDLLALLAQYHEAAVSGFSVDNHVIRKGSNSLAADFQQLPGDAGGWMQINSWYASEDGPVFHKPIVVNDAHFFNETLRSAFARNIRRTIITSLLTSNIRTGPGIK